MGPDTVDTMFFETLTLVLSPVNSSSEFLRLVCVVGLGATRAETTLLEEMAIVEATFGKPVVCLYWTQLGLACISIATVIPVEVLVATGAPVSCTKELLMVSVGDLTSFVDPKCTESGTTVMISVEEVAEDLVLAAVGTGMLTSPFDLVSISVSITDPTRELVENGVLVACSIASPVVSLTVSATLECPKEMVVATKADGEESFVAKTVNVPLIRVKEGTPVDEVLPVDEKLSVEAEAEEVASTMKEA